MACFVHIGHGKTGSSAIQCHLALTRHVLQSAGYDYPFHESLASATKGHITSGNGSLLLESSHIVSDKSIYSDETLFVRLANDVATEALLAACPSDLKVICYTRDFFDLSFSGWGQAIKRGGCSLRYEEFMDADFNGWSIGLLEYWLSAAAKHGFELRVFNYSRHKTQLFAHFVRRALKLDYDLVDRMSVTDDFVVNRSLTAAEYELQRLFNKYVRVPSFSFVSDPLVNELPRVEAERPLLSEQTYTAVRQRFEDRVAAVNEFLPAEEQIKIEEFETLFGEGNVRESEEYFRLSADQLDVLARGIAAMVDSALQRGACEEALKDSDADMLRDLAWRLEKGAGADINSAEYIMSLASRARPNGKLIEQELTRYRELLKNADR
ncbi:hypothetical protein U5801_27270 [Lamprobacter modestohalophilus]|uniref:hypothetical protein n=1 Tax=Lamprobacter modestohalophilus TaxID=1064514 RepID=UPI002ADED43B|nr:hypothetical protein [Lamprobacter modestohalophilus]MEA1053476.1 hypothetical protein [Lamprobacter modestohalophilus]